jgi:hypothetical protein
MEKHAQQLDQKTRFFQPRTQFLFRNFYFVVHLPNIYVMDTAQKKNLRFLYAFWIQCKTPFLMRRENFLRLAFAFSTQQPAPAGRQSVQNELFTINICIVDAKIPAPSICILDVTQQNV